MTELVERLRLCASIGAGHPTNAIVAEAADALENALKRISEQRLALEQIAELHPLKTGNELANYRRDIARAALLPNSLDGN